MATQSGPGKSYRKGITLLDAVQEFDTEDKAEAWFVEQRWPSGVACPFCGTLNVAVVASRKPQPFRCREKACRKSFSVKTGTLLHSSNLPLSKWAIAFFLYATNLKGVSSMKLHRDLGIAQSSAWYMAHRIRGMWTAEADKFAGPVEVDETYIGGKARNKHESKKIHAGRGAVGKVAVVGMKDRETGQVATAAVESTGYVHASRVCGIQDGSNGPGLHRRGGGLSRTGPPSPGRQTFGQGVRPRDGAHERDRELLGDAEAGLRRRVPPDERQTPAPLRCRVRGPPQ